MSDMRAVTVLNYGGPEQLQLAAVPQPVPGDKELLVRIRATAVNRADCLQRMGHYPPPKGASDLLGLEAAGEVVHVGSQCDHFAPGNRVFALLPGGGYAQYVSIPEALAMPIPAQMRYEEAAAIAEVFLTAWQALHWLVQVQAAERVLIHAGASGVGTAATQLAKQAGAHVAVTASTQTKLDYCQSLGADCLINYKEQDFAAVVQDWSAGRGVDGILDFVGAPYLRQHLACAAPDCRWVVLAFMGGAKSEDFHFGNLLQKRIRLMGSTLRARSLEYKARLTHDFVQKALPLFETGALTPVIYREFDWQDVVEAHRLLESNETIGKLILRVS